MPEQLVVGDDLSGTTEAAAEFLLRTTRIMVLLGSASSAASDQTRQGLRVLAVDTDSRHLQPAEAAARVRRALPAHPPTRVLKKVDSLLRGNLVAELEALAVALGRTPVVATALPSAGRSVVGGIPRVGGIPLARTDLWRAERSDAPESLADALGPLHTEVLTLEVVRSDRLAEQRLRRDRVGGDPVV